MAVVIVFLLAGVFLWSVQGAYTTNTYFFTYTDRTSLQGAGWSFMAITNVVTQNTGVAIFTGGHQNTEITTTNVGAVALYGQTNAFLGQVTRIPCDVGTIWSSPVQWTNGTWPNLSPNPLANQTRNSLFRSLPTNWVSLRLACSFAPNQNYQGVNLLLYQDDDDYANLGLQYDSDTAGRFGLGGPTIVDMAQESYGFPDTVAGAYLPGTNATLRLDRDPVTENLTGYYSTNNGASWVTVGQLRQGLTNTQVGIVIGGNPNTFPLSNLRNCDLSRLDIVTSDSFALVPVMVLQPQHLVFNSIQGQACTVTQLLNVVLRHSLNPVNWTVSTNASWLSAGVSSGQTPGTCNISVNTSGLTPGIHQGVLTFTAAGPANSPATVSVTLIINPNGVVGVSTWKHVRAGAMTVWVDDSQPTAFDDLSTNGVAGSFVMWHLLAPAYYTTYYQAGMELGSHSVDHGCFAQTEASLRYQIESNLVGLVTSSPATQAQVISLAWPCGFRNIEEEAVASDYFLVARGYNINQLEDTTPNDFMNVKSYNSHEHFPFPPADLKTVVDAAVAQGKWFNLVLHATNNDNGAIVYATGKNLWFAPGGTVAKYIYQRDRFVVANYATSPHAIQFNCYRLPLDASSVRSFETGINANDKLTLTVNSAGYQVNSVLVNGTSTSFSTSGNLVYFDALITTNSQPIQVNITSPNTPPALPAQPNRSINESTTMTVTNTATDTDTPAQQLTYTLVVTNTADGSLQANASINSGGVIAWTPTPAQAPGTYRFTTVVTDSGAPPMSATNSFTVAVQGDPLTLPPQPNRTIDELTSLRVTNTATSTGTLTGQATNTVLFNYPDRAGLIADGWSFLASNSNGTSRDTEITNPSVGVVAYARTNNALGTVLRVPCDVGDLWGSANNTRNSLFRSLPTNWTSLRLSLAFAPAQNYQQAQLALYQDDDNYVEIDRSYNTYARAQSVEFSLEVAQAANALNSANVTATNLMLRLDRSGATVTGMYSLDGTTWTSAGQTAQSFTNPRLGIWIGGATNAYANTHLSCDLSRLDIVTTNTTAPVIYTLTATNMSDGSVVTNATIDSNGVINWTPTEAQGPGTYVFRTLATYGVNQTNNSFTVTVREVNTAPVLPPQNDVTLVGLQSLTVSNTAADSDLPVNTLSYQLTGPDGASIDTDGVITWTPSYNQVPGTNTFTTVVSDGSLKATNSFVVTVIQPHVAPVAQNDNYTMHGGSALTITAPGVLANDTPGDGGALSAVQVSGPAAGILNLNADGGFNYAPTNNFVGADSFSYRAADGFTNSTIATVNISVADPVRILSLGAINGVATVSWTSLSNHIYQLQYSDAPGAANWTNVLPPITASGSTASATNATGNWPHRFYRVRLIQ